MWWLLGGGVLAAIIAVAAKQKPQQASAPQFLQFQALFKVSLQNDLNAGGTPLPAGMAVDALASTYAQVYTIGTREQLASAVADATARKYIQTAGILAQRPT